MWIRNRFLRITFAYAASIFLLSVLDLFYEWPIHRDGSNTITQGCGNAAGYAGVWEHGTQAAGLGARLHRPDFGFAGPTLITDVPPTRLSLIKPSCVLVPAWLGHLGWAAIRRRRRG